MNQTTIIILSILGVAVVGGGAYFALNQNISLV